MDWQTIACEIEHRAGRYSRPIAIVWQNHRLPVVDIGRQWQEDNDRHLLVRVADNRVFELRQHHEVWQARPVSMPPEVV